MHLIKQLWHEDDGVLSFEWTLVTVLVVFGIVSGVAAIRDAIVDELGDIAEAALQFDQSYSFAGLPLLGIDDSEYEDDLGTVNDCDRQDPVWGVDGPDDADPDGA
jgi:Flp pilus assembly pilin Flp